MKPSAHDIAAPAPSVVVAPPRWRDYLTLAKPEISFLVTISALMGFLLAPVPIDGWALTWTLFGIVLTAMGAGALNHYLERDFDAAMKRTAQRPIPAGRVSPKAAAYFGGALVAAGIGLLCPTVGWLTASLAILTVVLYLYVYTPLKRRTPLNTLVGTIPGALPALGGYVAATNTLGWSGWIAFAILVCWQMPHFLSLAWMYRKDYARGGYAMLTVDDEDGTATVRQTLGFTVALVGVSLLPVLFDAMGWLYLAGALVLGGWFLREAIVFYRTRTAPDARRVLKASIYYIPLLVLLIVADRLL